MGREKPPACSLAAGHAIAYAIQSTYLGVHTPNASCGGGIFGF